MAATVAVIAARKREQIFGRFHERDADKPAGAPTLEELGLKPSGMLRAQTASGAVVAIDGGRFHLDEEVVSRHERLRRRVVIGLLAIVVLTVLVLQLIEQARGLEAWRRR